MLKRFEIMSRVPQRVLVHFHNDQGPPQLAKFTECMLDVLGLSVGLHLPVYVQLHDNKLLLGSQKWKGSLQCVKMKRPSFCPIHNLSQEQQEELPSESLSRGIDVGCATIFESGDNKILLTRRATTMRSFPNVWVPPGGHVDLGETLHEAALRELKEETGIELTPDQCVNETIPILALWESTFPPKLSAGLPKRHHAVVYVYAKLKPLYTAASIQKQVKPNPAEVGALAWLDRNILQGIITASDEEKNTQEISAVLSKLPKAIPITKVNPDGSLKQEDLATSILYQKAPESGEDVERVSTGTKHALEEWLSH